MTLTEDKGLLPSTSINQSGYCTQGKKRENSSHPQDDYMDGQEETKQCQLQMVEETQAFTWSGHFF